MFYTAKYDAQGRLVTTQYVQEPEELPTGEVLLEDGLPQDEISRHFADCWVLEGDKVVVSLPMAKVKRAAFIVQLCDAALLAIDAKTPRAVREALVTGDKTRATDLETSAAALRAVRSNPGVDTCASVEEVAAYLPALLM